MNPPLDLPQILTGVVDLHHADHRRSDDLAAAKRAGMVALIHKATEGRDWCDPAFTATMAECKSVGIMRGAYHFGSASADGVAQADFFLGVVGDHAELLVLDLERNPGSAGTMSTTAAVAFVERVHETTGRWPVLYAGAHDLGKRMEKASPEERAILGRCPLWLAAYGPDPLTLEPPSPWRAWWLQQYTNGAAGPRDQVRFPRTTVGLGKPTDRSVYRGSVEQLAVDWKVVGRW